MDLLLYILLFVASLFALIKASDWFIGAAETIGLAAGISPFIIGVTFVAFGTSLPELATSVAAVLAGTTEVVVGNVVGSNIANVLLIVGITAVMSVELVMDPKKMDNNILMLLASTFFLWFTSTDGVFTLYEGILFLLGLVFFILTTTSEKSDLGDDNPEVKLHHYALMAAGAALVYFGARFTIFSLIEISNILGVSSEVIALTGVALGTSLPEVVVSINAVRRGKPDIAVGNVLGSNIFNLFAVMGIPALIQPLAIPPGVIAFSMPFMIAITIMFCFMFLAPRVRKWEGMILLVLYAFFLINSFNN